MYEHMGHRHCSLQITWPNLIIIDAASHNLAREAGCQNFVKAGLFRLH